MMLRRNDRILENIPIGALGIIALNGCEEMGSKVNVLWLCEAGALNALDCPPPRSDNTWKVPALHIVPR